MSPETVLWAVVSRKTGEPFWRPGQGLTVYETKASAAAYLRQFRPELRKGMRLVRLRSG